MLRHSWLVLTSSLTEVTPCTREWITSCTALIGTCWIGPKSDLWRFEGLPGHIAYIPFVCNSVRLEAWDTGRFGLGDSLSRGAYHIIQEEHYSSNANYKQTITYFYYFCVRPMVKRGRHIYDSELTYRDLKTKAVCTLQSTRYLLYLNTRCWHKSRANGKAVLLSSSLPLLCSHFIKRRPILR